MSQLFRYFLIRALTFPTLFLSYSALHKTGNALGLLAYHLFPAFRKRALSNLALASSLDLDDKAVVKTAKEAMQNLMITTLEYAKLAKEKNLDNLVTCSNPETAEQLIEQKQGIVFFCAHQANWELLFLEGTHRMPGIAIGRPIKNDRLYRWILSIRRRFGGKIISPKNALKEGLKALKNGLFVGIVGDQGMPESFFSSSFLGRKAFTSPLPAILSYRCNAPLIFASTHRKNGKYTIEYSKPIWPDLTQAMQQEVPRMMKHILSELEKSIEKAPGQWLWQHNRWKQQPQGIVKRPFRHDAIAVLLPEAQASFFALLPHLSIFREFYPSEFITLFCPQKWQSHIDSSLFSLSPYTSSIQPDYRCKLIFNFTGDKKTGQKFKNYSALTVTDRSSLAKIAGLSPNDDWEEILRQGLQYA